MAEQETGQEKTEEPTAKRLRDAREKGDIARSKELNTTVLLLVAAACFLTLGSHVGTGLAALMEFNFTLSRQDIFDPQKMFMHLGHSVGEMGWRLGFLFLLLVIAALAGPIALGGWNFSAKAMAPKFSRLNPLEGIKRMFSLKALVELFKGLAKFLVVGALSVVVLVMQEKALLGLANQDVITAMRHGVEILAWAFLLMASTMILITAVDVPYQLYDYQKKLRMTLQEVKDEMKNTEGKPEVKGRIRQLQHEIAQRRMMSEVPQADVVITNPEHYAVALRYRDQEQSAPVVVAKGVDQVALKIREIAAEHDVPVVTAPPLARAIYFNAELEQEIPEGLYVAVAQILAYVYQLREYQRRRGPKPGDLGDLPIPDDLRRDD
ncbi:flagellar biosynthesis protein FlhB [Motiliproteus sediminis]|uniref:flagellar biosynthesis protein FlhB n=1 Tax=Motiliproteus sediminis TaxID=1468178 RepID=UPI001AEF6FF1